MVKILMLKGLPASSKTTYAKELVDQGWARVNKDNIREMVNNSKWSKENEQQVLILRDNLIRQYVSAGYNVVVDDTNFGKHEAHIHAIAEELGADFEVKFFDIPVSECIRRDALREKPVGKKVIHQMFLQYLYNPEKFKEWTPEKQKAIIVDIDGTLAHFNGRTPFDYTKVKDDICDVFVKDIILKYYKDGYDILVVSGREDSCKDDTRDWLMNNDIPAKVLFMRKTDDHREDSVIKREIYENDIKDNWSVFLVLDDRTRVVEGWRSLGLKCLQCEPGDF
jgi:predicted kinase